MRHFTCLLLFLLPSFTMAQDKKDKPAPGDEMIYKYLCAETDKLNKKFMDGAKTIDEWKQKRPRLHQEYMDMLGLWPLPEKTPLKATKTGEVEAHGVVVEKIHFQSKPGLYVTANLYRPKALSDKSEKLPAIVYVCGHSNKGRDGNKSAYQDHGFWFANNGYVCIVLDTLQLGEIPGVHHGTYGVPWNHLKAYEASRERERPENHVRWWWHSAGYTPAGVEAWNGIRAIDYLISRADVDPERIGVTGISGGGAATFWIAAADERVKVAVPVSGMSDLESYVKNKVVNGHCDCMFLYNTYQWDWTTIAALVAPRPLLFANSDNDPIFPMDGNRRIIDKLRKCYGMYPKPRGESSNPADLVQDYVSPGGHAYREDLRIAIFKFINKHLKNDTTSKVEDSAKYTPLKGRELRVFPEDSDIPKDAINAKIDETFVPRAQVKLPETGKFAEWKKLVLKDLRERRFQIRDIDAATPPENSGIGIAFSFFTEPPLLATIVPLDRGRKSTKVATLVVQSEKSFKGLEKNRTEDELRDLVKLLVEPEDIGWAVFPRGSGGISKRHEWSKASPPNYVERSHLLLGKTLDQGRVYDILSIMRMLKAADKSLNSWKLIGSDTSGILAAYAALFEPSIKEVVVIDPPKSHKEGPHFLGVLRVLDIPEALGLLAPTPLTIIGGKDRAFDRTEEIYRLAGAADKLVRK